jgi:hypothetical protein
MPPKTIPCDNARHDGAPCGETALVHMVHYMYDMGQQPGSTEPVHVLRGTTYDIECPRCGRRQQTVNHG